MVQARKRKNYVGQSISDMLGGQHSHDSTIHPSKSERENHSSPPQL